MKDWRILRVQEVLGRGDFKHAGRSSPAFRGNTFSSALLLSAVAPSVMAPIALAKSAARLLFPSFKSRYRYLAVEADRPVDFSAEST